MRQKILMSPISPRHSNPTSPRHSNPTSPRHSNPTSPRHSNPINQINHHLHQIILMTNRFQMAVAVDRPACLLIMVSAARSACLLQMAAVVDLSALPCGSQVPLKCLGLTVVALVGPPGG
jgi:hypothetical protein